MPIVNIRFTVFFTVLSGFLLHFSTPSMATSLNEVIRNSLANSITLAAARQNWIATRESIGSSTLTSDLSARLTSTGSLGQSDNKGGSGFKKTQSFTTGVTLSKNLYDGGQTNETTRLGQIKLQASSANYAKVEQLVILTTIESYLDVLQASRTIKILEKNRTRLEAHVNATRIRVKAGAVTPTRLAEAKARHARAQSDVIIAKTRLANGEDSFQSLTKTNITSFVMLESSGLLPIDISDAEIMAQTRHPDMLSAVAGERAANQSFKTFKASVKPTLTFNILANTKHTNGSSLDKNEVAAQLVFSSPLISTNATRSTARSIAASYQEAKLNRAEIKRKISVTARGAFRNWKTTKIRLNAVLSEVEAFRLVAKGIANEAQLGQKTTLDLLDAEKDVNDAELNLVTAEHNQVLAAFKLKEAIGDLTAESFGLENITGKLVGLPSPEDPFHNTFPFRRQVTAD
ncbi:TolC family protein [Candidatus Puniceispirillum sp.]|nr:TolC family protein [Candidatus Puniceispirillum sp.]